MTLEEFSSNVVPIVQVGLTAIGLVSLFLLWWQMKQASNWNQLKTHHELLGYLPDEKLERAVLARLSKAGLDKDSVIPIDTAEELYRDSDAFVLVKSFLNKYEHFCAAINAGAVNEDYAYPLHWGRVISVYDNYENFVKVARRERASGQPYIELQKVAARWIDRSVREREQRDAEERKLEERLQRRKGVHKIV